MNFHITPIVKNLIILCTIIFVGVKYVFPQLLPYFLLYQPDSPYFKPVQMVTYMFMHADFRHLLFNMFTLFAIGSSVEDYQGPKRFLFLYLASGIAAGIATFILPSGDQPTVGASGAIYGVLASFGLTFPNREMYVFPLPIPIKAWLLILLYVAYDLVYGVSGASTGIAHFAHIGGALAGAIITLYFNKGFSRR